MIVQSVEGSMMLLKLDRGSAKWRVLAKTGKVIDWGTLVVGC